MDWQNCITLAPERKKCLGYIKSIYDDLRLKFFEDTNNTIVLMIIFFVFNNVDHLSVDLLLPISIRAWITDRIQSDAMNM